MRVLARVCLWGTVACGEPSGPEDCAEDEVFATVCTQCGPADECVRSEDLCAPPCGEDGTCETGRCRSGVCVETGCL